MEKEFKNIMNRSQLISEISERTGLSAAMVEVMLESMQECILLALERGEKVILPNFGRFALAEHGSRLQPGFVPSMAMKKRVSQFIK